MKRVKDLKVPGRLSYRQISEQYGISSTTLSKRVFALKIKGENVGKKKYFTQQDIDKILRCKPTNYTTHARKITIIEIFQNGVKGYEIAEALGISSRSTYECIKEYQLTGCVIVESKMNVGKFTQDPAIWNQLKSA